MNDIIYPVVLVVIFLGCIALLHRGKLEIVVEPAQPSGSRDITRINEGRCPDCGARELLGGPSGGMSQNIGCNNCLMEFNVGCGFGTGAFMVDRSGKMDESRARVFGIQPDEYQQIEAARLREHP